MNADFPRAIRFCVARCRESLREIAGGDDEEYTSEAERLLGRLDSELRYSDVDRDLRSRPAPFPGRHSHHLDPRRRRNPDSILFPRSADADPNRTDMLLRIQHETKLSYSEPVSETVFDVRMAPALG